MADAHENGLKRSCIAQQLAEVEATRAMYPEAGEFCTTKAEAAALEMLRSFGEDTIPQNFLSISFTVHLIATKVGGRHVSVGFSFPATYPKRLAARVNVECGGHISKTQHEILNLGAQSVANGILGSEAVFQVLQRVQELALEIEESATSSLSESPVADVNHSPPVVQRKVIWFHHIKSTQKRKDVLGWGTELKLGGYCKPGFPGVLILEGESEDVEEYVNRLHSLRWQAIQIRGEEREEVLDGSQNIDSIRRFPVGIKELPELGMSELAGKCREANLEQLFLTALKISR